MTFDNPQLKLMDDMRRFKFVYIPAEVSEPLEQWELEATEQNEVEVLLNRLKDHYAATASRKTAEQLQQQQQELLKNVPEGTKVDQNLLDIATSMNMVENVSLLSNAVNNGFIGVNMYCDDEGAIKDLPINLRASDIATCCGKPTQVRGDAFLARIFDNGDDFRRLDLTLSEVSSSAKWVREAAAQNAAKRRAESSEAVMERLQSNAQASRATNTHITELSPAESAKDQGNTAFKAGNFGKAVEEYSKAISLDSSLSAAYNNRAMAQLKLGNWLAAEADSSKVLAVDPSNVKALLRRGAARQAAGKNAEAVQDYQQVLQTEPNNKEAAAKVAALQQQADSI